jgi:DNA-binding transcriptional ArsR family regulator
MGHRRVVSSSSESLGLRLDSLFSALSDPTRRAILERLVGSTLSVGEVAAPFNMSLPAISKHLDVLERAKLIIRRRDGRMLYCQLNPISLMAASTWLDRYKPLWERTIDSLGDYLLDLKTTEERRPGRKR